MKKLFLLLLCTCVLMLASAQPGEPDPNFGNNGLQFTGVNTNHWNENGQQVLTSSDGTFFVVFQVRPQFVRDVENVYIVIARYLRNGVIDISYGSDGYTEPLHMNGGSAAMQEGKIVTVGYTPSSYALVLARYDSTGRPDRGFGEDGLATTGLACGETRPSVAIQNKEIIVAGNLFRPGSYNSDFNIARYTDNGLLDSTFGADGLTTSDFNNSTDVPLSVAVQDEKIVVAGYTVNSGASKNDFAVARFTSDGSLDSTFSKDGLVTTDFNNSNDLASSVGFQDQKIVVGGYTYNSGILQNDFAIARYTSDGLLDVTFSGDGKVTTDFDSTNNSAFAMAIQNGKILVAGSIFGNGHYGDAAIARYTGSGVLDSSFNENGRVITTGSIGSPSSIVLSEDRIIVTGSSYSELSTDFAVALYNASGSLDSSFGDDGVVSGYFPSSETIFTSVAMQGNKIVAAGYLLNGGAGGFEDMLNPIRNEDIVLARYTTAGLLDPAFGVDGIVTSAFSGSRDITQSLMIQHDQKIVIVANTPSSHSRSTIALTRYTAEGRWDSTFGPVQTNFGFAQSATMQDDKIVVAGRRYDQNTNQQDFSVIRYNANGATDFSFGSGGVLTTDFAGGYDGAQSVVIQGDKIVVVGNTGADIAVARYNTDGSLDSSFSTDGLVISDLDTITMAVKAAAIQNDKILVAGDSYRENTGTASLVIVRFTAKGLLDSTFGRDGIVTTQLDSRQAVQSIALQEGKFVVAANSLLARYNMDGSLDSTFSDDGFQTTSQTGWPYSIRAIARDRSRLYAVGTAYISGVRTLGAIAAYQLEGTAILSCPGDKTIEGDEGLCSALVHGIDPVLTPYDSSIVITYTLSGATSGSGTRTASGTTFLKGVTIVTYRLADDTTKTCTFTVTVQPNKEICNGMDDNCDGHVDEGCPTLTLSIEDVSVLESRWFAWVTVRLSGRTNKWVWVNYSTKDKTAVHSKDYIRVSGPLLFIPGFNTVAKVLVPIVPDNEGEGDEQFEIYLKDAVNAVIGRGKGTISIIDDDVFGNGKGIPGALRIRASPNPSWGAFTVKVEGPEHQGAITVRVYDMSGRMIELRRDIIIGQSIQLGHGYRPGAYIIEAAQGNQRVQARVMKSGSQQHN